MSTSYSTVASTVANTASQVSALRLFKTGLKQGQKRGYLSYLEQEHKINEHVRTLNSCIREVTYNIQKNAKTAPLVESAPRYLAPDNVSGCRCLSSIGQDTDDFLK